MATVCWLRGNYQRTFGIHAHDTTYERNAPESGLPLDLLMKVTFRSRGDLNGRKCIHACDAGKHIQHISVE